MRIAVCEDNKIHKDEIIFQLHKISPQNGDYTITAFDSGDSLWFNYQDHIESRCCDPPFDLIIMDIELPGMYNGVEVAKRIHNYHEKVMIVILTSYPQYALVGYEAEPLAYILKPIDFNILCEVVSKVERRVSVRWNDYLNYELAGKYIHVPYSKIIYLESVGHYVYIHTELDDDPERLYTKLSNIGKHCDRRFIQCHQSYIINVTFIESFESPYKKVILRKKNGERISLPISQIKKPSFCKALKEYDLWNSNINVKETLSI